LNPESAVDRPRDEEGNFCPHGADVIGEEREVKRTQM
jgi:hypothetical protein